MIFVKLKKKEEHILKIKEKKEIKIIQKKKSSKRNNFVSVLIVMTYGDELVTLNEMKK